MRRRKYIVELVPDDLLSNATSRTHVAIAVPKSNEVVDVPTGLVVDRVMHLVRAWLASLAPGHRAPMHVEDLEELRILAGIQSYVESSLGQPHLFDLSLVEWTRHVAYIIPEQAYKATAKLLFDLTALQGAPRLAWDNTSAEHFVSTSPEFRLIELQWAAALGLLMARFQVRTLSLSLSPRRTPADLIVILLRADPLPASARRHDHLVASPLCSSCPL